MRGHLIIGAVVADRLGSADSLTHDIDVLPAAREWLTKGLPVPTFGDLLPGHAQTQHRTTAGKMIQRHHGHSGGRWGAGGHRDDAGGETDPGGLTCHPGEWDKSLSPIRFRGP